MLKNVALAVLIALVGVLLYFALQPVSCRCKVPNTTNPNLYRSFYV